MTPNIRFFPPARTLISLGLVIAAGCQASTQADVSQTPAASAQAGEHQHTPGVAHDAGTGTVPAAGAGASGAMHQMDPDTRFMHHMIAHHGQALVMTKLVPERSSTAGFRLMSERIEISQQDETALMRRWLQQRGKPLPMDGDHTMHMAMPGMLAEGQLAGLAAARGAEFERLFLELMIRHHEGALTMVRELLGSQGAAQDSEMYRLASDIDADQRAEIARMRSMLNAMAARPPG